MVILSEQIEEISIIDAIKKRYEVKIKYGGKNEKGNGERIIQPVAYGFSHSGNPVVRAFQPFGDTKTKVPHWKLFRVDKIEEWHPLKNRKFSEPPSAQYFNSGKYNPNGDKTMDNSKPIVNADFEGAQTRYERGGLFKYNKERELQKIAKNPYYRLEKNINKSINAPDYVKKNIEDWYKKHNLGNQKSIDDMKKITNIGDNNTTSINGPILKNNVENIDNNISHNNLNYDKARLNGPIYKDNNNSNKKNK